MVLPDLEIYNGLNFQKKKKYAHQLSKNGKTMNLSGLVPKNHSLGKQTINVLIEASMINYGPLKI